VNKTTPSVQPKHFNKRFWTLDLPAITLGLILIALMAGLWAGALFSTNADFIHRTDFPSFWTGAVVIESGQGNQLYDMEVQRAVQIQLRQATAVSEEFRQSRVNIPYHNPPPLALVFMPFTMLPLAWAYVAWGIVSAILFIIAVLLPLRGHPLRWQATVLCLCFGGVYVSLKVGQVNALFLIALSLGLLALAKGHRGLGGAWIGLLLLKPQYALVFGVLFLVKRRWHELFGMALVGLGLGLLSLIIVGPQGIIDYLMMLQRIGGFYPPEGSFVNPEAMVNWRSMLMHVFPGISASMGSALVYILGGLTGLIALWTFRGKWDATSPLFARQMSIVTLATIILSPHSHFNGAVLLLAPLGLMLTRPLPGARFQGAEKPLMALGLGMSLLLPWGNNLVWLMEPYFFVVMLFLVGQTWDWMRDHARENLKTAQDTANPLDMKAGHIA
jgi:hypothetical protein